MYMDILINSELDLLDVIAPLDEDQEAIEIQEIESLENIYYLE